MVVFQKHERHQGQPHVFGSTFPGFFGGGVLHIRSLLFFEVDHGSKLGLENHWLSFQFQKISLEIKLHGVMD